MRKPVVAKVGMSLADQLKANSNSLVAAGELDVKQNEVKKPTFNNPMEEMTWMNSEAGKEWKANQNK